MSTSKKAKNSKKTVLIVDDHPMMRQGLAQLINNEPDLEACAEAEDAQDRAAVRYSVIWRRGSHALR